MITQFTVDMVKVGMGMMSPTSPMSTPAIQPAAKQPTAPAGMTPGASGPGMKAQTPSAPKGSPSSGMNAPNPLG